jgi:hypothetical protein
VTNDERIAKQDKLRTELSHKLHEIIDEAERLCALDPLWVFNDIHKIRSLVGQLDDITYKYRRLT